MSVKVIEHGNIWTIKIDRPERRNAVDGPTAEALCDAFLKFDADPNASVAILTGSGSHFCAGADLKALGTERQNPLQQGELAPMGPSRLRLNKPVIAAIQGYAVAGGLELALWADLRIAADNASFGVFCRRFGVPLIDGGTVRLPQIIGLGRAMDLILTGREVSAHEALNIGLINRICRPENLDQQALTLAKSIAELPQTCLRSDRLSVYEALDLSVVEGLQQEFEKGLAVIASGETLKGAKRFQGGEGRSGQSVQNEN